MEAGPRGALSTGPWLTATPSAKCTAASQQRQRQSRQYPTSVPARQRRHHAAPVPAGHRHQQQPCQHANAVNVQQQLIPARQFRQLEPPVSVRQQYPIITPACAIDRCARAAVGFQGGFRAWQPLPVQTTARLPYISTRHPTGRGEPRRSSCSGEIARWMGL